MAHLPNKLIGGLAVEPQLQDVTDTEPLVLTSEEAPRALQQKPKLHEAFLRVLDVHVQIP